MELMDASLDKFYKFVFDKLKERIPENILGKVTVAVSFVNKYILGNGSIVPRIDIMYKQKANFKNRKYV